jgi:cytoskeletal protein CcmA (bactofilin family)
VLFGKKKKVRISDRLETVLGQNAHFKGHLKCEGNLRIDGYCEGIVEATGNIVIGEMGQLVAEVKAKNVSVSGSVKGSICAERVDLLSTGRIEGDVLVDSFFLDEGGNIRGQVNMREKQGTATESAEDTPASAPDEQPAGEPDLPAGGKLMKL